MSHARRWLGPALVLLFGCAVALRAGRMGYMPLDQSIVFDGAWRVISGEVPYRDFFAPSGLTPIYLQVPFFLVLGTTWFAYLLHAAIANGIFGLLVARLLVEFELDRWLALAYGALSCVLLYPPVGAPYLEQHAFLFALAGIAAARLASRAEPGSRRANLLWFAVPLLFAAAWFAKQIPSAFALPIVLAIWLAAGRGHVTRGGLAMLGGVVFVGVVLALVVWRAKIDLGTVWEYHIRLPQSQYELRRTHLPTLGAVLGRMCENGAFSNLFAVLVGPFALAAVILASLARIVARRPAPAGEVRALGAASLGLAFVLLCLLFTTYTGNQWQEGLPLVFASTGLLSAALRHLIRSRSVEPRRVRAEQLVGLVLLLTATIDAWRFQVAVNESRIVNDLTFDPAAAAAASHSQPEKLAYLGWSLPRHFQVAPGDLRDLATFLAHEPKDFVLIGDVTVLGALAGKRSRMPSLWIHPGLTIPGPKDPAFADFDARVAAPFLDGSARYLVLEGERTFAGTRLADFPTLAALVEKHGAPARRFGFFRLIDLGTSPEGERVRGRP